ncbi:MAG: enoyl-CoA hydratase/isomerase family protein [Paracoccaceae bacterium]
MGYEAVTMEREGPVAVLTLNRPRRLNAMSKTMLLEMQEVCDVVEDDADIRALVVTGAGAAFSSGFDLQDQAASTPVGAAEWRPALRRDFDAVMRFWRLSKPTIAAVEGPALAGGCELALACDLTIAGQSARFGEPELKFGAGIVVMLLPWLVGPKKAKEIILLGMDDVPAPEALAMGMITRVVPDGEALEVAKRLARHVAAIDPMVVRRTKAAINETFDRMGMTGALEAALEADLALEGEGSVDKRDFLAALRSGGMKGALAWRDARFNV